MPKSTSTNERAPSNGGGGDQRGPPKPPRDEKSTKIKNETNVVLVVVESNTTLKNGERILKVSAVVRPGNLRRGTDTNNIVAKLWKRRLNLSADYHAGHIIACVLGGSGSDKDNLVPLHSSFNNGDFKSFELEVRKLLEECQSNNPGASVEVRINVEIRFAPGSQVPYYIRYKCCTYVNGVEGNDYITYFTIDCCRNGPHDGPYTKRSF